MNNLKEKILVHLGIAAIVICLLFVGVILQNNQKGQREVFYDAWQQSTIRNGTYFGNLGYKDLTFHISKENSKFYDMWFIEKAYNISLEFQFDETKGIGLVIIQNLTDMSEVVYKFEDANEYNRSSGNFSNTLR